LHHDCARSDLSAADKIADFHLHEVAATELAVDREVEQCAITQAAALIEVESDFPNLLRFQRTLRADGSSRVPDLLFGGRLSLQAAAFILRRTGIKGTDPVTQRIFPIGTQRTRGIELSAALDLPENIRAIAGYSHLNTRVTESVTPSLVGKRATLTPLNAANLFFTKTIAVNYGLGGGVNYVGDRWADPANTTVLPSYVTFDALAWAQVGPVRLQLNAYNLANKRYIVSGHGTSPILNLPGAPRSVIGTARFSF
jgi:catecholate siderophore receptor